MWGCQLKETVGVDDVPKGHVISLTVIHELGAGLDKHMVCVDAQGNKYTVKPFNSSDKLLNLEETNIGKRFLETVVARQESLKRYISSELQDLRFQMKKGLLAACGNVGTANRTQDASKENIEPTSSSFNEEVGPPNDESVEELLQTCEEHRNFFQKMFEALIKMTAEVAQQNEDDVNCIQQLLDYAKELRQEEKALFSKIESTCTHNQLSDEKHADRTEELQKWKTQHEVQFKEVEKLLSGLLNAEWKMERGLGNKERPPSRQKSLQERMSKYLPGYGRKSPISRRYSECDLPKETGAKLSHQKSLPEGISKSLPEYGGKSPRRYSECDPPKETGAKASSGDFGKTNVIDPWASVVSELQLSDISDDVGTCWRELGPKLDISAAKIQNLDDDYRCSRDKANNLLLMWKQKEGRSAVAGRLADALESIGKKCIAEKLLDNYKQKILRNCCCGETGKPKALYFIRASGPEKMFEGLIKVTAEVAQQSEDNVKCIQQLLEYTKELLREEIALFLKIELVCTQNQLSDEKHGDRIEELQKWKTQHEVQFKEVEKLLSGLLYQGKMERRLSDKQRLSSRRSSECDLPKETKTKTPTDAECDQTICASRQKMRREDASDISSESVDDEKNFQGEGYRLVDLKKLSAALSEAHVCKEGCLTVEENFSGRNGLLADPSLECSFCLEATPLETSARITKRGQSFDINRSAVYHFLETGGGYEGLVSFCSIMNMPCLSLPAYYKQVHTILEPLKPKKK
ncbi:hypothetical protein AWC38_SpisGene10453 [Stylophora pistillata]|uniref:Death domain-containing protein n=1 Tax=Stylophora pistillata TaxID=50429 RepID=A0A2B4S8P9_STYPI|nr:hypothetical protein AWC38_SpisGene10453 [Stylophora pistillata]